MRKLQKDVLRRFRDIANKHDIELEDIISIESSIWKMVALKMSEGEKDDFSSFHNIYIAGLGTFHASAGLHKYLNLSVSKRKNKESKNDKST